MKLLPEQTKREKNLAILRSRVANCTMATNQVATQLKEAHSWVWGLPAAEIVDLFNDVGAENVEAIFANNTALGTAVNTALDAVDPARTAVVEEGQAKPRAQFGAVAPTTMGREDIQFNSETGLFELVEVED